MHAPAYALSLFSVHCFVLFYDLDCCVTGTRTTGTSLLLGYLALDRTPARGKAICLLVPRGPQFGACCRPALGPWQRVEARPSIRSRSRRLASRLPTYPVCLRRFQPKRYFLCQMAHLPSLPTVGLLYKGFVKQHRRPRVHISALTESPRGAAAQAS